MDRRDAASLGQDRRCLRDRPATARDHIETDAARLTVHAKFLCRTGKGNVACPVTAEPAFDDSTLDGGNIRSAACGDRDDAAVLIERQLPGMRLCSDGRSRAATLDWGRVIRRAWREGPHRAEHVDTVARTSRNTCRATACPLRAFPTSVTHPISASPAGDPAALGRFPGAARRR